VEPIVRTALERLLLDPTIAERLRGGAIVSSCWTRDNRIEVDPVGGDAPEPTSIGFVGSIKWHEHERFTTAERAALAAHRAAVPGAADARLVIVSRTGLDGEIEADLVVGPRRFSPPAPAEPIGGSVARAEAASS
jgi:hypothetical protein